MVVGPPTMGPPVASGAATAGGAVVPWGSAAEWCPSARTWAQGDPSLCQWMVPAWPQQTFDRAVAQLGIAGGMPMSQWPWDQLLPELAPKINQKGGPCLQLPSGGDLWAALEGSGLTARPKEREALAEIGSMLMDLTSTLVAVRLGLVAKKVAWVHCGSKQVTRWYDFQGTKAATVEGVMAAAAVFFLLGEWGHFRALVERLFHASWLESWTTAA